MVLNGTVDLGVWRWFLAVNDNLDTCLLLSFFRGS